MSEEGSLGLKLVASVIQLQDKQLEQLSAPNPKPKPHSQVLGFIGSQLKV